MNASFRDEAAAAIIAQTVLNGIDRGVLSIWTVYDRPTDHPDGFIARRFDVTREGEKATEFTIAGELEHLRAGFDKAGLYRLPRQPGDDPNIVEVWL